LEKWPQKITGALLVDAWLPPDRNALPETPRTAPVPGLKFSKCKTRKTTVSFSNGTGVAQRNVRPADERAFGKRHRAFAGQPRYSFKTPHVVRLTSRILQDNRSFSNDRGILSDDLPDFS